MAIKESKPRIPNELAVPLGKALIGIENKILDNKGDLQQRGMQIIGPCDWATQELYDFLESIGCDPDEIRKMRMSDINTSKAYTPEIQKGGQNGMIKEILLQSDTPTPTSPQQQLQQQQNNGGEQ